MNDEEHIKVLRVVTSPECVVWHLGKTLNGLSETFDMSVAGQDVSRYSQRFPGVTWLDINISRKIHLLDDLMALLQLCRICYRLRPDIVHSVMPKAGLLTALAAWVTRVPVRIHTFTGQVWDTKTGWSRRFYKLLDRLVVALNTACLTDSPSQSRHLQEHGITLDGEQLPVLGLGSLVGVDLERFNPERIKAIATVTRASIGLANEHFVIAYVARKSRDKGAIDMLHGFQIAKRRAPHMRLLFIGPDESNGELESLRQSSPDLFDSVVERNMVSNHEEYLLISNVLCMPSYREGFGSIVLDAAALAVPSVGSRIVGLVDSIAENSTGLLFPAGDVRCMADLLCILDSDRECLERMGREARRRVEAHFTSEAMTSLLVRFYYEQLGS